MYEHNLGQKFKSIVHKFSESRAVISENESATFRQLDELSDNMAKCFLMSGLERGSVLCIAGEKRVQTIAAIIAAIKTGITYSVFDPDSPLSRLSKIFDKCAPQLILCDAPKYNELKEAGFKAARYSYFEQSTSCSIDLDKCISRVTATDTAYIMFTSGSTGIPKGAVMTHGNVLNLIGWSISTYSFDREDVLTNINPLFFDNSVFDLYSSLFSGACLALFDASTVREPSKLMRLLDEFKCTSWFSVPSMLIYLQTVRAINPESFAHIKRVIFGGEGYPKSKLKELFDRFNHRIDFYNVYGPTECTCICSSYKVELSDFADLRGFLPLGELAPNFDGIIVDSQLKLVPCGEVGELILRGPNVGLGYYRDPERTKANFVQNPTNNAYPEIVYRTGDLVYLNPEDQKLWIAGRADNQIKHMGYRIELEEIENSLSCIDMVAQAAVIHCEIRGLSSIVAFVVPHDASLKEALLRENLEKLLPNYMIPTRFQFVSQLPKNANGKIDRKHLKSNYLEQTTHV
jgi:D-alanine--poly(phosphoribitol) ligase subunit 1